MAVPKRMRKVKIRLEIIPTEKFAGRIKDAEAIITFKTNFSPERVFLATQNMQVEVNSEVSDYYSLKYHIEKP